MNWHDANTWANTFSFGGYVDWRLPSMVDTNSTGCLFDSGAFLNDFYWGNTDCGYALDTSASELAHLFLNTLGNLGYCPPERGPCTVREGWGLSNTGAFENLISNF